MASYPDFQGAVVYAHTSVDAILGHYRLVRDGMSQGASRLCFLVQDYPQICEHLLASFQVVHAAGGLAVRNTQVLFILRNDYWDLPKGHVDPGETYEQTAVRETMEECGLPTAIGAHVGDTAHTYVYQGRDVLKYVHWYTLFPQEDVPLIPQGEEGIIDVRWLDARQVRELVWPQTYPSIKEIYEQFEKMA